ncbi:MAG: sulfite exporter TauE/SafE family protein [Paracoccaceae bacterium]
MLELDIWFFLIAGPATLFAGISKGGFGSGAAFAGASILALVLEPGLALGVMLPLLMLIDAASLKPYWRKWDAEACRMLVFGALPGVALGAWIFSLMDADAIRIMIGIVSLLFVVWQYLQRADQVPRARSDLPGWVGCTAGCAAGFSSFVSHAGGPLAAVYLLSKGLDKTTYQASTVLCFWVINIAKAVPYAFLGLFTFETLMANILLAPFALLGTWVGVRLHYHIPETWFFALTYVLLAVTGTKLLWDGLT